MLQINHAQMLFMDIYHLANRTGTLGLLISKPHGTANNPAPAKSSVDLQLTVKLDHRFLLRRPVELFDQLVQILFPHYRNKGFILLRVHDNLI